MNITALGIGVLGLLYFIYFMKIEVVEYIQRRHKTKQKIIQTEKRIKEKMQELIAIRKEIRNIELEHKDELK